MAACAEDEADAECCKPKKRSKKEPPESPAAIDSRLHDGCWRRDGEFVEVDCSIACQSHKDAVYVCGSRRPTTVWIRESLVEFGEWL